MYMRTLSFIAPNSISHFDVHTHHSNTDANARSHTITKTFTPRVSLSLVLFSVCSVCVFAELVGVAAAMLCMHVFLLLLADLYCFSSESLFRLKRKFFFRLNQTENLISKIIRIMCDTSAE